MLLKKVLKNMKFGPFLRFVRCKLYNVSDFCLGLVFKVTTFLVSHGTDIDEVKKILLIRTDRIGDLILTTPAIKSVRETYPDAKIDFLLKEYTYDILKDNRDVDRILCLNKDNISSDYDLAIAFNPGFQTNKITYLSGAKKRIGYNGKGGSFFLTHQYIDDRAKRIRHEVETALEITSLAGCECSDKNLQLSVNAESVEWANSYLERNQVSEKFVLLHPGARQKYIRWHKKKYARLADEVLENYDCDVFIVQGPGEEQLVNDVLRLIKKNVKVLSVSELKNLIAVFSKASLFVGNSTGTLHIASALNIPTIGIFGSRHPLDSYLEWGPWSSNSVVVSKDSGCLKCHPSDCKSFKCMNIINVSDVFIEVKKVLGRVRKC